MLPLKDPKSPVARVNQVNVCGECHADTKSPTEIVAVNHPLDSYLHSIHGQLNHEGNVEVALCTDCHGVHEIHPKNDPRSKVFAARIPQTCGKCHEKEEYDYETSIHGMALADGVRESPTCTDCHGEHSIRPPKEMGSRVWRGSVTRTCSGCHDAEHINSKFSMPTDRKKTFSDSYHGLAAQGGNQTVANCSSCHGWHKVLPSSNPLSTVHPSNLSRTCGECHPKAGDKFAATKIHATLSGSGSGIARFFEVTYMILIPLVIGSMILHNTLDLVRKSRAQGALPPARLHPEIHMSVQERLQHGVMVIAFLALGYSGFALKYPDAWWAIPFFYIGGEDSRRIFHRAATVFFALVCVWHVIWLMSARDGRVLFRDMRFRRSDLSDIASSLKFYLSLQKTRPALPRFSYIEKAEYWALVWGTMVMLLTGVILVFHNMALQHFPLWVLETARIIHYMEAVLACLAIFVWHFYWVIYDPDVYPMNSAWITGRFRFRNNPDQRATPPSREEP
jgi:cytochrome b subunit of formate dehydrogenase